MRVLIQLTKIKILIIFCTTLILSCTKQKSIEDVFYTKPNEYWQYHTGKNYGTYIQFNKNKTSNRVRVEKDKISIRETAGDVLFFPLKWSVSKDSILTWDHRKYDIVSYNDKLIILYIQGKNETDGKMTWGYVYLVKGTIDNVQNEPGYFGYKRDKYPERYIEK